jgi:phage tail protein X
VEKKGAVVKKSVSYGDSLYKLSREVYGKADSHIVQIIKENNPHVVNPNVIHVGSTITFPVLSGEGGSTSQ